MCAPRNGQGRTNGRMGIGRTHAMSAMHVLTLTPTGPMISAPSGAEAAARFFRGLGDPTRLRILHILLESERSVSELVEMLGAPQGRVSSHLSCLRWCGFVDADRRGRNVFYSVTDQRVRDILALGDAMLMETTERLMSCSVIDQEAVNV